MNLAEDRRARVPFALVGVLLLVGSAALSVTLAGGPTARTDESVGVAVDRATAATATALRGAIARAGSRAASAPITDPVNTTAGRVLNDSTPFRDYLRIRIYLAARDALGEVEVRTGGGPRRGSRTASGRTEAATASVSLPRIRNASDLRRAKRRVEIEPVSGPESAEHGGLRVRIRNVTVTATRDGRVMERERFSPTLVTATPALALHERTERFESRLNSGPLAPGLGRRLTASLYAVAWARGYAQYGRAPVENVLANRHVELAANGALLREQRFAFGRSDPRGRRALGWATARVGVTDLLTAANARRGTARTEQLLAVARHYQRENPMPGGVASGSERSPSPLRVGVNRTADRAFAGLATGGNGTGLAGVLQSTYTADVRLVAAVRQRGSEGDPVSASDLRPQGGSSSGTGQSDSNWTLQSSEVETTIAVEPPTESLVQTSPGTPQGWHLLRHESRRVVRTHSLVARWTRGNETRRTVRRWSETFAVSVGVAGDHGAGSGGGVASTSADSSSVRPFPPERPVASVHERGGALDGPNLRGLWRKATERLVEDTGGFDALARRAVVGTLDTRPEQVTGRRPPDLRPWVYRDLVALRERVRNLSVEVARTRAIAGEPPALELARTLQHRRSRLLDVPARYEGVADRARVAARAAYLARVMARLESRAERANATRTGVGQAVADAGSSLGRARRILRTQMESAGSMSQTPPPRPMPADGPGRAVNLSVAGAPPYLTLAALDHEQVAAIPDGEAAHPLAARNRNVFAVPYGDAAETVAAKLLGGSASGHADLRTAALALRAANRTLAETANATRVESANRTLSAAERQRLARHRNALRASLAGSLQELREKLVAELAMTRSDIGEAERRAAVESGLARWGATDGRAMAVTNGSAARAIAAALTRRRPALERPHRRDWVRLRTELAVESVRRRVPGPPRSQVNRTGSATRNVAKTALKQAVTTGLANATEVASERWFGEVLGAVPAGMPVAPVPGYWYATVNVWTVSVRGQYARFTVSAPQGTPGESVSYVRESATVRLDWDGDGTPETVGRTTPVAFETETVVLVVVPPGPPGVGDRGGNRDETSPGWSSKQ